MGGRDDNSTYSYLGTVERYNSTQNSWTFVAPMAMNKYGGREFPSALAVGGFIYLFGGGVLHTLVSSRKCS